MHDLNYEPICIMNPTTTLCFGGPETIPSKLPASRACCKPHGLASGCLECQEI